MSNGNFPETIDMCNKVDSGSIVRLDELLPFHSRYIKVGVAGDCLEGAGIEDGGGLIIDTYMKPNLPKVNAYGWDIILCYGNPYREGHRVMVKRFMGMEGYGRRVFPMVGTFPKGRMGSAFTVDAVLGTACAYYAPDGTLVWTRDLSQHPEKLPDHVTFGGEAVPVPFRFVREAEA